jgi:RNA recognition motif-containing protein
MKLYVNNLSEAVTEIDLQNAFKTYGEVNSVRLIRDKNTGRLKGYAFVDMPNETEASAAIDGLYGEEIKGQFIGVNQARTGPKDRRLSSRGGGRRRYDSPSQ